MVAAMTLSAFAVYQASRASDEASSVLDQSRIVATAASRQEGYLQTLVDNDLDVLRSYCPAELKAGVAQVSLLGVEPDLPGLVTGNLLLESLRPMLLGDRLAICSGTSDGGYRMDRAAQSLQNFQKDAGRGSADGPRLEAEADVFQRAEQFLMTAGLLFAVAVSALIAVDQLGERRERPSWLRARTVRRGQYALLGLAAISLGVGVVLLTVFAVDFWVTGGVYLALGLALLAEGLWSRHRRRRVKPEPSPGRARPQWWAEIAGALALIAFTTSAVGLTLISIQERDSTARANEQESFALALERAGQQQALRALAALTVVAQFEAETITARQLLAGGEDPDNATDPGQEARDAMRTAVDEQFRATDQRLRDQTAAYFDAVSNPVCAVPLADEAQLPSELFDNLAGNPGAVFAHVVEQQLPALACDYMTALSRYDARIWSSHRSMLTVALVVLGLAGFLLALASGSERSWRSSWVLLTVGVAGTILGIGCALSPVPALISGTAVPHDDAAQAFSDALAGASSDPCGSLDRLDAAIETFDGYGPAFQARALARECGAAVHGWQLWSSDLVAQDVGAIYADFESAVSLGPEAPGTRGTLGWIEIVRGVQGDDPVLLLQGLENTKRSLERWVDGSIDAGWVVHSLRFNRALAYAALGERDAARTQYREAVFCLEPENRCPGGGLLDPALGRDIRLWALADLELLEDSSALDEYRLEVVGTPSGAQTPDRSTKGTLEVYPQELRVTLDTETKSDPPIVWYYREDDRASWAILPEPSRFTLGGGRNLSGYIAAGAELASGLYRADVYIDGRRQPIEASYDSDEGAVRRVSGRLGMSVVVPQDWWVWMDDGVEWHVGPDESTGITLRRVEGMAPDDIDPFLNEQLSQWSATVTDEPTVQDPDHSLFGLTDSLITQSPDGEIFQEAGFATYGAHWGCGGTLFLARVSSDSEDASTVQLYNSLVLERPGAQLPDQGEVVETEGMSLAVPAGWDVAVRPEGGTGDLVTMRDCAGNANVLVITEEVDSSLDDHVEEVLAYFRATTDEFPGFILESDLPIPVSGSDDARMITFTWLPEGLGESIHQWQVYAKRGSTILTATISTPSSAVDDYQSDVDTITSSLEMSDP